MEYHNELYGYIQSKAIEANEKNEREGAFDIWLVSKKFPQSKTWIRVKNGVEQPSQLATLHTYIRNIHHPKIRKIRCLRKGNCNSL